MIIFSGGMDGSTEVKPFEEKPIEYRKYGSKYIEYYCQFIGWSTACSFDTQEERDSYFEYLTKD